jgi:hypothetical protein
MNNNSGTPQYVFARANTTANADALGIIIHVIDGNNFTMATSGRITVDYCVPNEVAGTVLFLSEITAGVLTSTEPSGNTEVSKPMAVITIANSEMIMLQQRGEVISTAGISIADDAVTTAKIADDAVTSAKIAAGTIVGVDIADGVITAQKLASGSVGTSQLANNQVTGDKIALGSDAQGDVMYYNGTDWVRLGFGTSGHFLKTQGTGANPLWAAASSGPSQAVKADIEAETNQDTYIPPDLMKHHPGVAKFWVDIDHSSGAPVIDGDYNVGSLDDNGTGNTDINYTVAFANANYAVVAMGSYTGAYVNIIGEAVQYHTTSYQRILCIRNSASNAGVNINGAFVAGFGDH